MDVFRADRSNMLARYLASGPQSEDIVSVTKYGQNDAYQIDLLDRDGHTGRSWIRSAPGFGNERAGTENIAFEPPAPRVTGAWFDESGLLWVLILTADADYTPLPRSRAVGSEMRVALTSEDRNSIWDSILEVIDIRSGDLLARRRFPQYFFGVKGRNLVFHYQEGEDGQPTFPILRPILHSPSQEAHRD